MTRVMAKLASDREAVVVWLKAKDLVFPPITSILCVNLADIRAGWERFAR